MISITPSFVDTILDLTCEIQQIPAPTFHEEQRAAYFLNQFKDLGLQDAELDPAGNVLARFPGKQNGRPLVVSAHMDTVHPFDTPLIQERKKDRISGHSIGDNSLGLASLLGLICLLKEQNAQLPGDLWLSANVCEEGLGDLRGIQAIVNRFEGLPLAYLVVEGMGLGNILHRGLGVERYRVSIETPGGHSWVNYGEPSAIHELCRLVTHLAAISLPHHPCTSLNVGIIHGGTSVNSIAAHAWLELDLRSEDSGMLARLVNEVSRLVRTFHKPGVTPRMERIGKRQAGALAESHPLIHLARQTLLDLGIEPHLDIASTDANYPLSRGYPAVCIGISNGNNAHSAEEFILTEPVGDGMAQLYELVVQAWDSLL